MTRVAKYSRFDAAAIAVLLILAVLAYAQVAMHERNGLDDRAFLGNEHVVEGLSAKNASWALTTTKMAIWHPITWWTYQIESSLFGSENDGARHIVNLLLHLMSVVICYLFSRQLFTVSVQGADQSHQQILGVLGATFVAFLFAFHPQHVQVIAWLSERKELLAALFSMLSIYAHIRGKLLLACIWFMCALMSKASALPMAFVIVAYDLIFARSKYWVLLRQRGFYYLVMIGLALTAAFFTLVSQQRLQIESPQLDALVGSGRSFYEWGGYIVLNLGHYLKTLFLPWPLPIFMHRPETISQEPFIQSILLISVACLFIFLFRKNRWVLFGSAWFLLFWLPTSGVVNIGDIYVADRYMYQAHIGSFIVIFAILLTLSTYLKRRFWKYILLAPVLVALCLAWYFSRLQTSYWETNIGFYEHELVINPHKKRALVMLGRDHQRLGNYEKAHYYYEQLLENDSHDYYGNMYSGFLNMKTENYPLAAKQLMLATQYGKLGKHHYIARSYEGLAWVYLQMGKTNMARRLANRGLKVFPNNQYLQGFIGLSNTVMLKPKDTQVLPK